MRRSLVTLVLLVLTVALTGVLSGCGAEGTGDKGYIDGHGVISEVAVAKRKPVGPLAGPTLDGGHFDLADHRGKVVVVNVWGSWCAPCRAEASTLVAAAKQLTPKGVVFVGINTRDSSRDNARAFTRSFRVGYPSIFDPSGRTLLSFRGAVAPNAIPSTIVIDPQGRVAASVLGELTSKTTLADLVADARTGSASKQQSRAAGR